jgi:FkbM family methyltransferase
MMSRELKNLIKSILPEKFLDIIRLYLSKRGNRYFSQEGEDIILQRIFERKQKGFYIDVGAHHPFRFSNTYIFYKRGWRGINIDASPGSMKLFKKFRPRDINLEIGVANKETIMKYYIFNEPALNTFDEALAKSRDGLGGYKIVEIVEVKVIPLQKILDEYLPANTEIDFMNIDVEGMDFEVLKSNDWVKYRPMVLLVEVIPANTIEDLLTNPISVFLKENGYSLFAKCFNTCIFVDEEKLEVIK